MLQPHSAAKLRLISRYFKSYFPATIVNLGQVRQRITLIDGFCGGGKFEDRGNIVDGTPFLLMQAVEEAQRELNKDRIKALSIDAEFHFVDKMPDTIDYLRTELISRGYGAEIDRTIFLHCQQFENVAPDICQRIKDRTARNVGRSIFLLDQKGYTDVSFVTIRNLLQFTAAEVILTFAVGFLVDYLSDKPQTIKGVLPIEISDQQILQFLEMKEAWGGRYVIQRGLLRHIKAATGALFQSPFFIRSVEARKDLWLVHLSNHLKARNVMVDAHWAENNQSVHQGHGGLEMLGFNPNVDAVNAPDFWFGQNDKQIMHEKLAEDFLRRLHSRHLDENVQYGSFIQEIANESPARLADFDSVTSLLVDAKELDLRNINNIQKRSIVPNYRDTITVSKQHRLVGFFKR